MNWWLVSILPEPPAERVRIPYSPTFLEQVREGNVRSISSKGDTVQGELRSRLRCPPGDSDVGPVSKFDTEVPTFANEDELSDAIAPLSVIPEEAQGPPLSRTEISPETARLVDEEVKRIVDDALDGVRSLLAEHRDQLDALAESLLEHETLDTAEAYRAAGIQRPARPETLGGAALATLAAP